MPQKKNQTSKTTTQQTTRFLNLLSRPVAQSYPPSCITIDKKLISTFSHPVAVDRHALSAPLHVGTSTCQCFWTFECKEVSAQTCWCEGSENETEHNMQEGHLCTHVRSNRQGMCWISTLCADWHQTNSLRKSARLYRRWKIHVFRRKSEQWTQHRVGRWHHLSRRGARFKFTIVLIVAFPVAFPVSPSASEIPPTMNGNPSDQPSLQATRPVGRTCHTWISSSAR